MAESCSLWLLSNLAHFSSPGYYSTVLTTIHMAKSVLLQVKKDCPPDWEDSRCSTLPAWNGAINHSSGANEWDLLSGAREGKNRNTSYLIRKKSTDWQWLRDSPYPNGSRLYYSFGALQYTFRETVGHKTLLMFIWKTDCAFCSFKKYLLPVLAHWWCFYPLEGTWSHSLITWH